DQLDVFVRHMRLETVHTGPTEREPDQAGTDHLGPHDLQRADPDRIPHLLGHPPRTHLRNAIQVPMPMINPSHASSTVFCGTPSPAVAEKRATAGAQPGRTP